MWILPGPYLATLVAGGLLKLLAVALRLPPTRGGPRLDLGRALEVALLVAAVGLGELAVARALGATFFAVVMQAWIDLALVAPVAGLCVLVAERRGRATSGPLRALAAVALAGVPLAAWASLVEPRRLVVERPELSLPAAREGREPLRIGVLADLQCERVGAHERRAVAALMAEAPDLVLVPGDLFQGPYGELRRLRAALAVLLAGLEAPGGVFVVGGNCDRPAELAGLARDAGLRLLEDEVVELRVRDRRVRLLGLADGSPATATALADFAAQAAHDPGAVHLVLAHRPRVVLALPGPRAVDLVVGGHTHGGQVVLPFFGPPLTLSPLPRRVAAGGLHEVGGNALYVSRGLGMERHWAPRLRFLCPPEVTLLTLR